MKERTKKLFLPAPEFRNKKARFWPMGQARYEISDFSTQWRMILSHACSSFSLKVLHTKESRQSLMVDYYRFRITLGFVTHLWKSATRQDHADIKNTIVRYLPPEGVAIDVGAHGGQFTRLLARLVSSGKVVAIEPSGYTRSILRMNLWVRRCRNVIVVAAALGSNFGTTLIRTPIKQHGDMGYGLANLIDGGSKSMVEPIAIVTLDSLVEQLGLDRVDFIKADIEGYEAEMIRGAHDVLQKFRPAVLLEMDNSFLRRAGSSLSELWEEMLGLGFAPHNTDREMLPMTVPLSVDGDVLWLPMDRYQKEACHEKQL